jgi:hypothetical protein
LKGTGIIVNRRHLTTIASTLATAALGLTVGITASAGASATTSRTSSLRAAAPAYVLYDCDFKGRSRPATEILTCADAGMVLHGLRWASWTPNFASANGALTEKDCLPSCVQGHFHEYPAVVVAWGSGSVTGHPAQRRYTHLTLIFTGARPPVYVLVNGRVEATHPVTQTLPA